MSVSKKCLSIPMVIDVAQLRESGRPFQVEMDFADQDLQLRNHLVALPSPARCRLNITLTGEQVCVEGSLQAALEVTCSRCLNGLQQDLNKSFRLDYLPDPAVSEEGEEFALSYAELSVGFYRDDRLNLNNVIQEQIFLAVPMKSVCSSECKGLCDQCGANLNEDQCNCGPSGVDPRWAVLAEMKNRLEN